MTRRALVSSVVTAAVIAAVVPAARTFTGPMPKTDLVATIEDLRRRRR